MIFAKILQHLLLLVILGLIGVVQAQSLNATQEDDADFMPITQQPLVYYPQPRIVGGSNAYEGQFPYQISLRVGGYHICGGSIISSNYVVTAAHCVTSGGRVTAASRISVRAGSVQVNSGGQIVGVSAVIKHPSYRNFNNDIALLKLSSPLQFNDRVKAVALASQAPPSGARVVTSGWGRVRSGGSAPRILQYGTLTALTNGQCRRRLGQVPNSVLCLGHSSGSGVCNGDSGGPAVYQNQLVGVTNFIVGNCGSNRPDGYASVAVHYNWLKNNSDV